MRHQRQWVGRDAKGREGREGARPGVKWLGALELKRLMGSASFGRLASLAASRLARA